MVDEARQASEGAPYRICAAALALALLHGCAANLGLSTAGRSGLPAWPDALGGLGAAYEAPLLPEAELPTLRPDQALVVVDPNWRLPGLLSDGDQRAALRAYVEGGGRLVLFGFATRLVSELGIEAEVPEVRTYRWGFDRRARRGDAQLSLHFVTSRSPELRRGLAPSVSEHSFAITGGAPCSVPLCAWQTGAAQSGEVLAHLGEVLDGRPAPLGPPVLLRWRHGQGEVLACGVLPDIEHEDEGVRANARAFDARCAEWAGAPQRDLVLLGVPERAGTVAAADADEGPPIVPLLAHWGWQAALYDGAHRDAVRPVNELVDDVLAPSAAQGADLFELTLSDAHHGAPISWSDDDPIEQPPSWRGAALEGGWNGGLGELATEAHARGVLLFGGFDVMPVGDRPVEQLVALRMHARELAGARRLSAAAFDGFGVRDWWHDPLGYGVAMVQDYQPAATLYSAGECAGSLGGGLRALDADDGAMQGVGLSGIASGWRDGFAGDLYPVGVLDARLRAEEGTGALVGGGGSHTDWLAAQFVDFVRDRRLQGGAALWRRHDPRTLGPRTEDYVQGLSMEPLRAAVAMPLAATGRGGVRAAAAALVPDAQRGFGAPVDAPAVVHALQNNWFQLLGSGGALRYDPTGQADFGEGSVALSAGFLTTRIRGARPTGAERRAESVDFLENGHRGSGGYARVAVIGSEAGDEVRCPGLLARGAAPEWPEAVEFEWTPSVGYHELRVQLRPERGQGIVTVSLDGTLLQAVPCQATGRTDEVVVPVHVARPGTRRLRLELFEGHAVAIDRLQVQREGDLGVEAEVTVPAGSLAQLVERSRSSHHEELVALTACADVPGFVARTRCVRAARNLQIERKLSLPGYTVLREVTEGEDPDALRRPFVLGSEAPGLPDICVVPLHLARYERLRFEAGAVVWRGAAQAGLESRVGFLLCPRGDGPALLPHVGRLVDAFERPLAVDLGPDGGAVLVSDLEVPHSRLLHVADAAPTPMLVRERGYWTWRACQPAPDGGAWLRVHQSPGDKLEVVGGPSVFARTRPGTGSRACVALRDPTPRSATAVVLQPSRLRAPSVEFSLDFDEVEVNDEPWAWFEGRTVFLPDEPGEYEIRTRRFDVAAAPGVASTAAPLRVCRFEPSSKQLVLVTEAGAPRPTGLPYTAVLRGPMPSAIENGEIVPVEQLHLPDDAAEAAAQAGGVLIRFRPGTTVLKYDGWSATPGR